MLPNLSIFSSTICLDVLNHKEAIKPGSNVAVIVTEEEIQRREKIPKRATIINTCIFIIAAVLSMILIAQSDFDQEGKTFVVTMFIAIVNALRNPLVVSWTFQVNQQIRQETVDERRNKEIEEALRKRAERRNRIRANPEQTGLEDPEGKSLKFDPTVPKVRFTGTNGSGQEKLSQFGPNGQSGIEHIEENKNDGPVQLGQLNQNSKATSKQNSMKPEPNNVKLVNELLTGIATPY